QSLFLRDFSVSPWRISWRSSGCGQRLHALPLRRPTGPLLSEGGRMKTRTTLLALVVSVAAAAIVVAADANVGTWKLNAGKSKLTPGGQRNNTVVVQTVGDNMKVTVDGTDGTGKATHNEWTGKFDGKD